MIDPRSLITKEEYEMLDYYREIYLPIECGTPIEEAKSSMYKVLGVWAEAKERLLEKFGNSLIHKKPFHYTGDNVINCSLENIVKDPNSAYSRFKKAFFEVVNKLDGIVFQELLDISTLQSGTYEYMSFTLCYEGRTLKIRTGTRLLKVLHRIVSFLRVPVLEDLLKEFEKEYSVALSNKEIEGNLCVSIHPLDYLTMSDNAAHWTTCTSVRTRGDKRIGTIEMMNSPYVIVAYIEDPKSSMTIGVNDWNNKLWRELILVTSKTMINIKGYPYYNDTLSQAALEFVNEILGNYKDSGRTLTIDDNIYPLTEYMYNDFFTPNTNHYVWLQKDSEWPDCSYIIDYAGITQCLWCGQKMEVEADNRETMICDDCLGIVYCSCCGDRLYPYEAVQYDKRIYCGFCANELGLARP